MNTTEEIKCWFCEATFLWAQARTYQTRPDRCEKCTLAAIESNLREAKAKAEEEVAARTPARFRDTLIEHPDFNRRLWDNIKAWRPSGERPWLGMIGPTGVCKTRCAYLLFREVVLAMIGPHPDPNTRPRLPKILALTATAFGQAVTKKAGDDRAGAIAALQRVRVADVLLIDDMGKATSTPAFATEFFAMVSERYDENRATIWTANSPPEDIAATFPEDMAAPLVGRIRECSKIINLQQ